MLGPLPFLYPLFINGLSNCGQKCSTSLLVDVLMLYTSSTSKSAVQNDLQLDVNEWFKESTCISIANAHICSCIIIGTRERLGSDHM